MRHRFERLNIVYQFFVHGLTSSSQLEGSHLSHLSLLLTDSLSFSRPRSLFKLWLITKTTILIIPVNSKDTHLTSSNLNRTTMLSMHLLLPRLVTLVLPPTTVLDYTIIPAKTHTLIGTPSPQNHTRVAIPVHKPTSTHMRCPKLAFPLQFLKCNIRGMHKVHIPYNNHSSILHVQECIGMAAVPLAGLSLGKSS